MDTAFLVDADFAIGSSMVSAIEQAGIPLKAAMWLRVADDHEWSFALSSVNLDDEKPNVAYGVVSHALEAAGIPHGQTRILVYQTTDPFIKALRRIVRPAKRIEGLRLRRQPIGNLFVEDLIVYRMK